MRWLWLLLLGGSVLAQRGPAQTDDPTPADSLQRGLTNLGNSVWLTGQNAAGLPNWQSFGYGITTLGATHNTGDFRRPQAPRQQTAYALSSEGLRSVGRWLVYGEFAYQKTRDQQISFSHGYDPFNGNPYLWADTLAGEPDAARWTRDHIRARVALSSPRLGRWRVGLTVPYHVGQGSRLLDPKPFYRVRELGVLPSVWYQAGPRWGWGVVAGGQSTQEENEVGYFATDYPLLYRLRGYGSFSRSPVVTAERLVSGTVWQGRLQTLHHTNPSAGAQSPSWLGQVGGQFRRETIREGVASPEAGGKFAETTLDGLVAYVRPVAAGGSRVALRTDVRNGIGTDPILRTTGATYLLATAAIDATRWRQTAGVFRRDGVRLLAESLDYQDKITQTNWSAVRLTGHYDVLRRWERSDGGAWQVGATAGVRWIPATQFNALRPTRLTTILTRPDYQIQTTSAALLNGSVGRDFRIKRFGNLLHRVDFQFSGQFTDAGNRLTGSLNYHLLYL